MSRFSFQSRRQGFRAGRRKPNNKGLLAGLNLGCGLFLIFLSAQVEGARPAALLGLPFILAAWFVLREKRLGLHLSYGAAAVLGLLSVLSLIFTGRLIIGLVMAFAVYYLVKQATQFDAFLEQRELDAFDGLDPEAEDAPPPSAKERFEQKNSKRRWW